LRYQIRHHTSYRYDQAVYLKPQLIRLRPRSDCWQTLERFAIAIEPKPQEISSYLDLDGNCPIKAWFTTPTESLVVEINATIETHIDNPFAYLLEPWAINLPLDYPQSLLQQLQPYLQPTATSLDPAAIALAQEIYWEVEGNLLGFLGQLQQRIYNECGYLVRDTGSPWPPGITWVHKQGSCRDFALLFMEVCRSVGLAARFVSGYQEGDQGLELWELHAWVEVYLPGGGWRGYDPTHGLVVADRHIALVASAIPSYTAPMTGEITQVRSIVETGNPPVSKLETAVQIQQI